MQTCAGYAFYALAFLDCVHVLLLLALAPRERFEYVSAVVVSVALNIVLVGLLIWVARGVTRGERFRVGFGLLAFIGIEILFVLALSLTVGYGTHLAVTVTQMAFIAAWILALVWLIRAWLQTPSGGPSEGEAR